jgi:Glycosyl-4,4'-diaponeurosporenoate acyltransferase
MTTAHHLRRLMAVVGAGLTLTLGLVMLAQVIGYTSPWIALLLMFDLVAVAKVAEPLFVLRMPAILGRLRPWEYTGMFYRQVGVRLFGTVLRNTPLRFLNTGVYLSSNVKDLHGLYRRVASSEASHFWAALLFLAYIAYLYLSGQPRIATGFFAVQVLFNIYPILHLRLLRARLDEILQRQERRVELAHATSADA